MTFVHTYVEWTREYIGFMFTGTCARVNSVRVTDLLVFIACFLLSRYCILKMQGCVNGNFILPPGPQSWPLIGNLHQLGTKPHVTLGKMTARYGNILTVYFGPIRSVVLSDLEIIKETMIRQADIFSDRQIPRFIEEAFTKNGSVLWENGAPWRQHRRMIFKAFRTLGFRQKQFHSAIILEIEALCACLQTKSQNPFEISPLLTSATANVISSICFGHRYDYEDSEFSNAITSMLNVSTQMSGVSIAHVMPKLYHTPLYNGLRTNVNNLVRFIDSNIQKHREDFDRNNIRDVVDVYLSVETLETEDVIWRGIFDLFTAGSETTADTILWAILYMMIYPDIQKKVQEELDSVLEYENIQYPESIRRLPYTYATLLEVHRHESVAPLSVPRVTSRNASICGYKIPKGTSVWINEWALHNDPVIWGDPEVFRPTRFLDCDEKRILPEKKSKLVLFGYGLRQCLGKRLAEMETFMMFCGLMRKFNFRVPSGCPKLTTDGHFGLTYTPLPFQLTIDQR